ncbi:hypothetical protein DL765_007986 [Monosporascus sp. GIB2]|nr:hypothetical protein DL765_007986 [Monosporascus sp. GIB2]
MAETASLVVGVVALAGLFKDCVDLFSCTSATKSLSRDYEALNTELDIEKTLLLQRVDRVQLLSLNQYDLRLENKTIQKTVSRILSCIRQLLGESRETPLTQRIYWVIKDKERFCCLVHQLSDLVAELNDILPPADGLFAAIVKSDLGALQSLRGIQMVLQTAKEMHDNACLQANEPNFNANAAVSMMALHLVYIYFLDKCESRAAFP